MVSNMRKVPYHCTGQDAKGENAIAFWGSQFGTMPNPALGQGETQLAMQRATWMQQHQTSYSIGQSHLLLGCQ